MFITENPFNSSLLGLHLSGSMYKDECIAEAKRVRESWSKGIPAVPEYFIFSDEYEDRYGV